VRNNLVYYADLFLGQEEATEISMDWDAFLKGEDLHRKAKRVSPEVKGKESWRDLSITKTCQTCGKKFHPSKNGYQHSAKFCSAKCIRKKIVYKSISLLHLRL